jgi:hypothetical protein
MEIYKLSEVHALPGNGRGRNLSEHGKKTTEQGTLTLWRWQRKDLSGHEKDPTNRGALTN